jgi:hypothetical protein
MCLGILSVLFDELKAFADRGIDVPVTWVRFPSSAPSEMPPINSSYSCDAGLIRRAFVRMSIRLDEKEFDSMAEGVLGSAQSAS